MRRRPSTSRRPPRARIRERRSLVSRRCRCATREAIWSRSDPARRSSSLRRSRKWMWEASSPEFWWVRERRPRRMALRRSARSDWVVEPAWPTRCPTVQRSTALRSHPPRRRSRRHRGHQPTSVSRWRRRVRSLASPLPSNPVSSCWTITATRSPLARRSSPHRSRTAQR